MSAYSKQLPAFSNLAQAAAEMQIEQTYTQLKKRYNRYHCLIFHILFEKHQLSNHQTSPFLKQTLWVGMEVNFTVSMTSTLAPALLNVRLGLSNTGRDRMYPDSGVV